MIPVVYTVREVRVQISQLLKRARAGETIYLGPYGKAQAVLISVERLAELEARPDK